MSTFKSNEPATSAPAHAIEWKEANAERIAALPRKAYDATTDHKFVYVARTAVDHTTADAGAIAYEVLALEPRVTKKEAQWLLDFLTPAHVTTAANRHGRKVEADLNPIRVNRPAPFRPMVRPTVVAEVVTPEAAPAPAEAPKPAAKRARRPRKAA